MRARILAMLGLAAALLAGDALARPAPAEGCEAARFEGAGFVVCRYRAGHDRLRLAWKADGRVIGGLPALERALGNAAARVRFAMNAGMYDRAQAPVGLFVREGETLHAAETADGAGNFYLKPNGVFWVGRDGRPHVDETSVFLASGVHPLFATQSGPLLVRAGALHPAISQDGPSRTVRNGVGVCGLGLAIFAISDGPVSMGRLARFLRDELRCPDVLYLDGSVSSLWAPGLKRQDRRTGLGPLVVVMGEDETAP